MEKLLSFPLFFSFLLAKQRHYRSLPSMAPPFQETTLQVVSFVRLAAAGGE